MLDYKGFLRNLTDAELVHVIENWTCVEISPEYIALMEVAERYAVLLDYIGDRDSVPKKKHRSTTV